MVIRIKKKNRKIWAKSLFYWFGYKNLDRDIHEYLSTRASNGLKMAKIETFSDLVSSSFGDILCWKNIGRKTILEIVEILLSHGLKI